MKAGRWIIVAGVALFGLFLMPTQGFSQGGGKAVFQAQNCTKCHSVKSQGIATKATGDTKVTDLSKVGSQRSGDWMKKYLLKETDIKGKKHKKKWSGSDAELTDLVKWLGTLK